MTDPQEDHFKRSAQILNQTTDFVGTATLQKKVVCLNKAGRELMGIDENEDLSSTSIPDYHPSWTNQN